MGPSERTTRESCVICLKASPIRCLTKLSNCDNNGVTSLDKIETLTGLEDLNVNGFDKYSLICNSCRRDLYNAYAFHNRLLTAYNYWNSNHSNKQDDEGEDLVQDEGVSLILADCEYFTNDTGDIVYGGHADHDHSSPFVCVNCKETFVTSLDMFSHICNSPKKKKNSTTNNRTVFDCTYCNKSFRRHAMLSEHLSVHTGEKNFCCQLCGKTFRRSSSVSRHMKTHEQPPGQKSKKSPFLCNICGKSFPYTNGLQRHMRIHNGVKPHECQLCGNKFRQSTHLQVHLRTHTGEKPYVCEECGDSFSLNATLQKHINYRHRKHAGEDLRCEASERPIEITSDF